MGALNKLTQFHLTNLCRYRRNQIKYDNLLRF
nr:MAG TPA: hypothetical protein [Caudoviricetes sp.]